MGPAQQASQGPHPLFLSSSTSSYSASSSNYYLDLGIWRQAGDLVPDFPCAIYCGDFPTGPFSFSEKTCMVSQRMGVGDSFPVVGNYDNRL